MRHAMIALSALTAVVGIAAAALWLWSALGDFGPAIRGASAGDSFSLTRAAALNPWVAGVTCLSMLLFAAARVLASRLDRIAARRRSSLRDRI